MPSYVSQGNEALTDRDRRGDGDITGAQPIVPEGQIAYNVATKAGTVKHALKRRHACNDPGVAATLQGSSRV
jgi:hypothetical protein